MPPCAQRPTERLHLAPQSPWARFASPAGCRLSDQHRLPPASEASLPNTEWLIAGSCSVLAGTCRPGRHGQGESRPRSCATAHWQLKLGTGMEALENARASLVFWVTPRSVLRGLVVTGAHHFKVLDWYILALNRGRTIKLSTATTASGSAAMDRWIQFSPVFSTLPPILTRDEMASTSTK